jgi:hypothetical protein
MEAVHIVQPEDLHLRLDRALVTLFAAKDIILLILSYGASNFQLEGIQVLLEVQAVARVLFLR